jgi:hypothetical protein
MKRVVINDYAASDNLDSDSEYILDDDVLRKMKQVWRLTIHMMRGANSAS